LAHVCELLFDNRPLRPNLRRRCRYHVVIIRLIMLQSLNMSAERRRAFRIAIANGSAANG
jgi:hypothetical protein